MAQETRTRRIANLEVEQTVLHWDETDAISVDYRVVIDLWEDEESLTSHDRVLSDSELRNLLREYGLCL